MESNDIPTAGSPKKNLAVIGLTGAVIAAIASGGIVYAYEKHQQTADRNALQAQIDTLKAQVASVTPSPTASPAATMAANTACATASYGAGVAAASSSAAGLTSSLTKQWLGQFASSKAGADCQISSYEITDTTSLTALPGAGTYMYHATFTVHTPAAPKAFWYAGNGTVIGNAVEGKSYYFKVADQGGTYVITDMATSPFPGASATPVASATATPGADLTATQLLNFTYKNLAGDNVTLKNGAATFAITGGPGTLTLTQNGPSSLVEGDLDGDGVADSVVQLVENDGGTGYFTEIAAVLNKGGQPVLAGTHAILDDRNTVTSITISSGLITVNGLVHGAGQASADAPNQPKTETYKVVGGVLVAQ